MTVRMRKHDMAVCSEAGKMDHDINTYLKAAEDVAKKVGEMILDAISKEKRITTKSSVIDLVTETDQKVEETIIAELKSKFPTHSFIGEESVSAGKRCDWTDNPTWIIDPIDGTMNFVHGFPHSAVSIGLTINKQVEVGIIYNPMLKQMFTARRGEGAFCNGERLQVSQTTDLINGLIFTEYGSDRDPGKTDIKQKNMRTVMGKAQGIRSIGTAALSMAMVASGAADAYFEFGIHCWDVAAGELLIKEAGGFLVSPDGSPFDMMSRRVLCASSESLARQLVPCIQNVEYDYD